MDGIIRFFSEEERQELERIATIVFDGGKVPARFTEASEKWADAISRFLMAVNRENGSMSLNPFDEYPAKTFLVMAFLQNLMCARIKKKMDALSKKSRGRGK